MNHDSRDPAGDSDPDPDPNILQKKICALNKLLLMATIICFENCLNVCRHTCPNKLFRNRISYRARVLNFFLFVFVDFIKFPCMHACRQAKRVRKI